MFHGSNGRYGYRRVHAALRAENIHVSKKAVRITKEENLVAKRSIKRKYSSYKGKISEAPENIVRIFHTVASNQPWLADITEFSIPASNVRLSPIIDCFDGMRISWSQSTSPNAELVNTILDAAAYTLTEGENSISHSGRGCHYRCPGWIERCKRYGITRSMSKKGCHPNNSAMEGFFGHLKVEFFYGLGKVGRSEISWMRSMSIFIGATKRE